MQLLLYFEIQSIKMSPAPSLCTFVHSILKKNITDNKSSEQTATVEIESLTREQILL